jgi:hypothetical protein
MKIHGSLISDTVFYTDQQSEMQYFQTLFIQYPTDNICQQHCQRSGSAYG